MWNWVYKRIKVEDNEIVNDEKNSNILSDKIGRDELVRLGQGEKVQKMMWKIVEEKIL